MPRMVISLTSHDKRSLRQLKNTDSGKRLGHAVSNRIVGGEAAFA